MDPRIRHLQWLQKSQGVKIYINGKEQKLEIKSNKLTETIKNKAPLLLEVSPRWTTLHQRPASQLPAFQ